MYQTATLFFPWNARKKNNLKEFYIGFCAEKVFTCSNCPKKAVSKNLNYCSVTKYKAKQIQSPWFIYFKHKILDILPLYES